MKHEKALKLSRYLILQAIVIGIIKMGETTFFFFEQNYLNLYVLHVLRKPDEFVSIMVSTSAIAGLILQFVFGVVSDNTRSKWGRRRPYFIFGGLIAGISIIVFAFSGSFWLCLFLDGFAIAVGTNAYLAAERSLIPDTFEPHVRGRANGIIQILGNVGLLIGLVFFLLSEDLFGYIDPIDGDVYISQFGFQILLSLGGVIIMVAGILGFIFVKEIPSHKLPERKSFAQEISGTFNIAELKKQKEFAKLLIANTLYRTGIGVIMPFLFAYILGLKMSTVELLIAIMGLSFPSLFIGTYFLGALSDKFGRKRFLPIAIFIVAAMISIVPAIGVPEDYKYWLVLICFPFVIMAILGFDAPLDTWTQDLLPPAKRGQFVGILNIAFTISQVVGTWVASLVIISGNDASYRWVFPAGAAFLLLSIPIFLKSKETLDSTD